MKRTVFSLALAASLAAGAAFAADTTTNPTQPPKKHGFDPDQIICKRVDVTDSHLGGQKVCATWAQWDAQSQVDQQAMRDAAGRPGMTGVPGGMGLSSPATAGGMHR